MSSRLHPHGHRVYGPRWSEVRRRCGFTTSRAPLGSSRSEIALIGTRSARRGTSTGAQPELHPSRRRVPLWLDSAGLQNGARSGLPRRLQRLRGPPRVRDGARWHEASASTSSGGRHQSSTGRRRRFSTARSYGLSEQPYFQPGLKAGSSRAASTRTRASVGRLNTGDAWAQAARLGTKKISRRIRLLAALLVERGYRARSARIEGGSAAGSSLRHLVHTRFMQAAVAHVGYGDFCEPSSHQRRFNTTSSGTVKDRCNPRDVQLFAPTITCRMGRP